MKDKDKNVISYIQQNVPTEILPENDFNIDAPVFVMTSKNKIETKSEVVTTSEITSENSVEVLKDISEEQILVPELQTKDIPKESELLVDSCITSVTDHIIQQDQTLSTEIVEHDTPKISRKLKIKVTVTKNVNSDEKVSIEETQKMLIPMLHAPEFVPKSAPTKKETMQEQPKPVKTSELINDVCKSNDNENEWEIVDSSPKTDEEFKTNEKKEMNEILSVNKQSDNESITLDVPKEILELETKQQGKILKYNGK